jgi:hypothetical protein
MSSKMLIELMLWCTMEWLHPWRRALLIILDLVGRVQPLVEVAVLNVVVDEQDEVVPPNAVFKTDDVVVADATQQVHLFLASIVHTGIHCFTLVLQLLYDQRPRCALKGNSVQYPIDTVHAVDGSVFPMVVNYVLLIIGQSVTVASLAAPEPSVVREWCHRHRQRLHLHPVNSRNLLPLVHEDVCVSAQ